MPQSTQPAHKPLDGRCSVNHLQSSKGSDRIDLVRCGNLASGRMGQFKPLESLRRGVCCQSSGTLPFFQLSLIAHANGSRPAVNVLGAFPLAASVFVGLVWICAGRAWCFIQALCAEQHGTPNDSGAALENAQWVIKSICTDRTTPVRSGPEWGASQKHRLSYTRKQVVQPVHEGLGKIRGASGETTPYRVNRVLQGALGCFDGLPVVTPASTGQSRGGQPREWIPEATPRYSGSPSKHLGGEDGHRHHPWGN